MVRDLFLMGPPAPLLEPSPPGESHHQQLLGVHTLSCPLSVSQPTTDGGRACGLRIFGHFVLISNFLFLRAGAGPIHMPIQRMRANAGN